MQRIACAGFILFIVSCAPARFVKPLQKKQQAVNVSLGGALISYSKLTIPMPFVTATYGYGVDSTLTAFGSLNVTSLLYGNLQAEIGVTKQLVQQRGGWPGISVNPVANIIYRKDASKLYPEIDINAFWDYNHKRNFFYAGISNWFEFTGTRVNDQKQEHHWIFTPMVGETFVRRKWNYNVELKMIAPNIANNSSVVDYKTPFGTHGAFGIYIGCTRKF
ncbi:MAG: hypothetical protein M3040_07290 [Bacteroidota bacterium]|nr:hypothetical protein [Bacteroidota bacterium]